MVSVKKASEILRCSSQHTRLLIRKGQLEAQQCGAQWNIDEASLQQEAFKRGYAENMRPRNRGKLNALSFFSGAMGLDIGLEQAGFETCLASEIDRQTIATIHKNLPEIPVIGNILDYSHKDILNISGFLDGEKIDLMVGGPPCQAFSTAGKRQSFNDERGNVFLHYVDLICKIRPRFAVIENVRGLLSAPLHHRPHNQRGAGFPKLSAEEQPGGALKEIILRLKAAGFNLSFNLYNAVMFGTPQVRERVIIICSRDHEVIPYLEPTHSNNKIDGLPRIRTFKEVTSDLISHEHIEFPEKRKRFYRLLGSGENWRSLPDDLQKEAMGKSYYSSGGRTGFLRRIAWDKPAPTLVTHPAMPATDLAHPEELRPLSVEEYKRVQEFPDEWEITGTTLHKYRQIGNAVPVGLGRAIGLHLQKIQNNQPIVQFDGFKYSRYLGCDHETWMEKNGLAEGMQLELPITV